MTVWIFGAMHGDDIAKHASWWDSVTFCPCTRHVLKQMWAHTHVFLLLWRSGQSDTVLALETAASVCLLNTPQTIFLLASQGEPDLCLKFLLQSMVRMGAGDVLKSVVWREALQCCGHVVSFRMTQLEDAHLKVYHYPSSTSYTE